MNLAKQLYALQEVDLELEKKREILSQVESQIGDSQAVKQAQDKLESERKQLAERDGGQKELAWQLDDLQAKISQNDKKLYGGSIRNPKELTSLQEEVAQLKARRSQIEEKFLEIMVEIESSKERIVSLSQELQREEAEWRQNQEQLIGQQSELKTDVDRLAETRREIAQEILAQSLELYETLRRAKQGRAIAKVEQGRCHGCRLNLSVTDLRRVRASTEMVSCSSCGRLLFLA